MDRSFGEHCLGIIHSYLIGAIVNIIVFQIVGNQWWGGFIFLGISAIIFVIWIMLERRRDKKFYEAHMKRFRDHEDYLKFLRGLPHD